jgi:hypothetical protein
VLSSRGAFRIIFSTALSFSAVCAGARPNCFGKRTSL